MRDNVWIKGEEKRKCERRKLEENKPLEEQKWKIK